MGNRAIFITRHNPSANGGGNFATRAFLEAVCKLFDNRVTLFVSADFDSSILNNVPDNIIKVEGRNTLEAIAGLFYGNLTRFQKSMNGWLEVTDFSEYEWAFMDGGIIGGTYIEALNKVGVNTCTIHHNFEVDYHRDNKSIESFRGRVMYWVKILEERAYKRSDKNLFLTEQDLMKFESYYGKQSGNFELGCFEFPVRRNNQKETKNYFPQTIKEVDRTTIKGVISGSLNTVQTLDSIKWFLNQIYPKIIKKYPNFQLTLTGRDPSDEIVALCDYNNVILISSPIDIREVISSNHIYICPIKLGGGLKLRIMDAIGIGMPCLIQANSFRGYEVFDESGIVVKFNDELDFMDMFEILLKRLEDSELNLSDNLKLQYISKFGFEAGSNRLNEILKYN